MKKFSSMFLAVFVLAGLWAGVTGPAAAYYPPLAATGTNYGNSVSREVNDPSRQKTVGSTSWYWGDNVAVVGLQQQNGVIAWHYRNGNAHYVTCCVYDPGPGTFKEDTQGPFNNVTRLTVVDGVVAYIADIPAVATVKAHQELRFSTYDPAKGSWQNGKFYKPNDILTDFLTKDGVVVYRYSSPSDGPNNFKCTLYEPQWGKWAAEPSYGSNAPLISLTISNATVHFEWDDNWGPQMSGYSQGGWGNTHTQPFAYFVAQPEASYKAPLWVWFTDMSIAGTSWNWNFGDGATGTERSPGHTYAGKGAFKAIKNLNNNASTFTRTIYVGLTPLPSWTGAYSAMTTSEDLGQLRRYRDEVLNKTARGNLYRNLLYTYSEDALKVLLRNPEMLRRARALIEANQDAVAQVLQGEEAVIVNPQEILNFLQTFGQKSPPELRELTGMIRRDMLRKQREGKPFQVFRLDLIVDQPE